jgi:hypothetical protein
MRTRICLIILSLSLGAASTSWSQLTRVNDRTWAALRGGIYLGTNQTYHLGDVPMRPAADNTLFTTGRGSNFTIGGIVEKPMSRSLTVGLRASYDPMNGDFQATVTEPYRIADAEGTVYNVERTYDVEYTLQYFSLGAFVKMYLGQGPGLFIGSGINLTALLRNMYYYNTATLNLPEPYQGSTGSERKQVSDANAFRASLDVGVGYEFFVRYAFISPEIHYDLGLNKVMSTSWSDNWSINNLRIIVTATFPLVVI